MTGSPEKPRRAIKDSLHRASAHTKTWLFPALLYRLPLPVTHVLILPHGDGYPVCPRCGHTVDREYMRYCDRCGQHLSWELFDHAKAIPAPWERKQ